ncbi:hypothetical protein [Rhizohabitans arisaemae]|uniref:hypothetical protein n=1 Tax=Rhizohabitans arisaemae TaxID=2720610 RepID=UPI0024B1AC3D|nr:hypothetical protein [Rhizohabitans arisaemae]
MCQDHRLHRLLALQPFGALAPPPSASPLDPWWALVYYAAFAPAILGIAVVTVKRRAA